MRLSLRAFQRLVLLLALAFSNQAWAETDVSPTDPNIRYIGRWDKSNPAEYHSYWSCAYFRTKFSGTTAKIKLTTGYGCSDDKLGLDQEYFTFHGFGHEDEKPQVPWTFAYTPTLIVINLGQNDQCGSEPPATRHESYLDFIHKIRTMYATVPIVAMRPLGGALGPAILSAVNELRAASDPRVFYVDTTGWLEYDDYFDGVHPHYYGSFKAAHRLADFLTPLLK